MNLPSAVIGKTASIQIKSGQFTTQVLDLAKDAGFGMVRRAIAWNITEKPKGVYNFVEPDAFFANMDARGMSALVTLYANNPLYETHADGSVGITTQAGREGFAAFAAACAARYAGRNIIWEIWNEPNITSFWHAPGNSNVIADEYTALVNLTVPAMMAADPTAYVVAGSISALWSQSFAWFDRCVAQGILTSEIKGISVHPYGLSLPEQAPDLYAVIRGKIGPLSIVTSEIGFALSWIVDRQAFTAAEAPIVQGHCLARQQILDLMSGIGMSNWYEFKSDPRFAIVNPQFAPLPAYNAAKTLTQQLAGYKFIKRMPTANPSDYVIYLRNDAGNKKLAVWTISPSPGPPAVQPVPHEIILHLTGADGAIPFVDSYGVAGSAALAANKMTIMLDGGPKYIDAGIRGIF